MIRKKRKKRSKSSTVHIDDVNRDFLIFKLDQSNLNKFLTLWKKYEVAIDGKYCWLYNDQEQYRKYRLDYFMTESEYRDTVINSIL